MTMWEFIFRSIFYHRRGYLGLFLGVGIACTVLTGALMTGDSIRHSLKRIVEERLGKIHLAMDTRDRFVRQRLPQYLSKELNTDVAGILRSKGIAINPERSITANRIEILGVDPTFWRLGNSAARFNDAPEDEAIINRKLAKRLQISVGDSLVIRVEKPSFLPRDVVLIPAQSNDAAIRLVVTAVLEAKEFGNFNLRANQIAPYNVFIPLKTLQKFMNKKNRLNLLLVGNELGNDLNVRDANRVFQKHWSPADMGLEIHELTDKNILEIQSERVFLDRPVVEVLSAIFPEHQIILTYFC